MAKKYFFETNFDTISQSARPSVYFFLSILFGNNDIGKTIRHTTTPSYKHRPTNRLKNWHGFNGQITRSGFTLIISLIAK